MPRYDCHYKDKWPELGNGSWTRGLDPLSKTATYFHSYFKTIVPNYTGLVRQTLLLPVMKGIHKSLLSRNWFTSLEIIVQGEHSVSPAKQKEQASEFLCVFTEALGAYKDPPVTFQMGASGSYRNTCLVEGLECFFHPKTKDWGQTWLSHLILSCLECLREAVKIQIN